MFCCAAGYTGTVLQYQYVLMAVILPVLLYCALLTLLLPTGIITSTVSIGRHWWQPNSLTLVQQLLPTTEHWQLQGKYQLLGLY